MQKGRNIMHRKLSAALFLFACLLVFLCSCKTSDDLPAAYISDLGFTLEIPRSWIERTEGEGSSVTVFSLYAAEERSDSVRFYDVASAHAGFGGTLVTVRRFAPDEPYDHLPDYQLLAETDAARYVASFPTDVQTDPANAELLAQHQAMAEGLSTWLGEHFFLS